MEELETTERNLKLEGMEGLEGIDNMDAMSVLSPEALETLNTVTAVGNFLLIIFYLLFSWGIYMLAKKMNLKRAWMSWIPLLQYYPMAQAGGKNVVTHFVYPLIAVILSFVVIGIGIAMLGTTGAIIGGLLVFVAYIYMIVKIVQVLSGISKNTGRGGWTTCGLFFLGFIMFPIVGYKYVKGETKEEDIVGETKEETKVEL